MHKSRRIGTLLYQPLQHLSMQRGSTFGLDCIEHCQACELVAEADRVSPHFEQAAGTGLVDRRLLRAQHRFDEPALRPFGRYGDKVGELAGGSGTS